MVQSFIHVDSQVKFALNMRHLVVKLFMNSHISIKISLFPRAWTGTRHRSHIIIIILGSKWGPGPCGVHERFYMSSWCQLQCSTQQLWLDEEEGNARKQDECEVWCDIVTISSQGYQPTRHLPPLLGSDGGLFLLSPRRFSFSKQTIFIWTSWLKCGPHMSLYRKWKSSPFDVVRITICCSTDCLDNWLCAVVGGTIVTLIPKQKLNSAKFISILCFWQGNYILRSLKQYISIGR